MHRVLGALKHEGEVVWEDGKQIIQVIKGNFWLRLIPGSHWVYFSVDHRLYRHVLSGRLYSDGGGNWLGERVYVLGWDRSAEHRHWQRELFETFSEDSDWLLSIPQRVLRPEIVTAVLSHIAAERVRLV
jgi:hypothetical protein